MSASPPPVALTVAGSDSGGGAGLQADLKTWEALGVYGASVVTCVTAQNTREVRSIEVMSAEVVRAQLDAVLDDLPVRAMKTGLLASVGHIHAVADALRGRPSLPLVVDPVLMATTGAVLAAPEVAGAVLDELLPVATLITPNLAEAEVLTGRPVSTVAEMRAAAARLVERGARAVLVKGGHLEGAAIDILVDERGVSEFAMERLDVGAAHGTGCVLSAAIAGGLARGRDLHAAVSEAKHFVSDALRGALDLGRGSRVLRFQTPD